MKILVVGGGGREHTLIWKLAQSPKVPELFTAPGNAGTAQQAYNLPIVPNDIKALLKAAKENNIDLTVVGPEAPLAAGIVDAFNKEGLAIFGPSQKAAQIEASKVFAKELMLKYGIPCARGTSFSDYAKAREYVKKRTPPFVVKADGLAAGKGVVVAEHADQALDTLKSFMEAKTLGTAGERIIVEEHLSGREMSTFIFTDGAAIVPMVSACDYKRIFDGDSGPNTGGMGSYSPPPFLDDRLEEKVKKTIMEPTVEALRQEDRPYKGVLYGGLMVNKNSPKVLEFNARFGDPETQVVLPRLKTDLVDIILAVVDNNLDKVKVDWSKESCVGVVIASGGYPGSYETGFPIAGLEDVDEDVIVFHAGTKAGASHGEVVTSGGRVLTVVAMGKNLVEAREKVYNNTARIRFDGCHYRRDIAEIKDEGA